MFVYTTQLVVIYLCVRGFHGATSSDTLVRHTYHIQQRRQMYYTAYNTCKQQNMELPIIKSEEEAKELEHYLEKAKMPGSLLGLTLMPHSSKHKDFRWSDGTAVTWTGWASGEPNYWRKCVITVTGLGWSTSPCAYRRHYVCQETSSVTPDVQNIPGITSHLSFSQDTFTYLPSHITTGEPLTVIQSPSLMRCVAQCLLTTNCDVISVPTKGRCSLFPPASLQLSQTPSHAVYQKMATEYIK